MLYELLTGRSAVRRVAADVVMRAPPVDAAARAVGARRGLPARARRARAVAAREAAAGSPRLRRRRGRRARRARRLRAGAAPAAARRARTCIGPELAGPRRRARAAVARRRAATGGRGGVVLVAGESGVGKTHLADGGRAAARRRLQVVIAGDVRAASAGRSTRSRALLRRDRRPLPAGGLAATDARARRARPRCSPRTSRRSRAARARPRTPSRRCCTARRRAIACSPRSPTWSRCRRDPTAPAGGRRSAVGRRAHAALPVGARPSWFAGKRVLVLGTYRAEEATAALGDSRRAPVRARGRARRASTRRSVRAHRAATCSRSTRRRRGSSRSSPGTPRQPVLRRRVPARRGRRAACSAATETAGCASAPTARASTATPTRCTLPLTMRELIARRLDGLSAVGRALARVRRRARPRARRRACSRDAARLDEVAADEGTAELIARQVLERRERGGLRFVHDKLREVAYERSADDERRGSTPPPPQRSRRAGPNPASAPLRRARAPLSDRGPRGAGDHVPRQGRRPRARRRDVHRGDRALPQAPHDRRSARRRRRSREARRRRIGDTGGSAPPRALGAPPRRGSLQPRRSRRLRGGVARRDEPARARDAAHAARLARRARAHDRAPGAAPLRPRHRDDRRRRSARRPPRGRARRVGHGVALLLRRRHDRHRPMSLLSVNEIETAQPPIQVASPYAWLGYTAGFARLHGQARFYFDRAYAAARETSDVAGGHFASLMESLYPRRVRALDRGRAHQPRRARRARGRRRSDERRAPP